VLDGTKAKRGEAEAGIDAYDPRSYGLGELLRLLAERI
jgi:hypothetical protein